MKYINRITGKTLYRKEVISSRVSINNELKIIQFWLANDEDYKNPDIAQKIDALFLSNKQDPKYRKIIYHSGMRDLSDTTTGLIKKNYTV